MHSLRTPTPIHAHTLFFFLFVEQTHSHTDTHTHTHTHTDTHTHTHTHTYTHTLTHTHTHTGTHIHNHTYTHRHTCKITITRTETDTHTHTHTHTHAHTHTQTHRWAGFTCILLGQSPSNCFMHACVYMCVCVRMYVCHANACPSYESCHMQYVMWMGHATYTQCLTWMSHVTLNEVNDVVMSHWMMVIDVAMSHWMMSCHIEWGEWRRPLIHIECELIHIHSHWGEWRAYSHHTKSDSMCMSSPMRNIIHAMNESCHIEWGEWRSLFKSYEKSTDSSPIYTYESCHVNGPCHAYEMPPVNESCHSCEWVVWMGHVIDSCHTYERVMSHIRLSHVAHMNACMWIRRVTNTASRLGRVTHTNESRHTYVYVMWCMWMRVCEWVVSLIRHGDRVVSHIWMSYVAYRNEWCDKYECVMSRIWRIALETESWHTWHTNEKVTSRMIKSRHEWVSCVLRLSL